MLVFRYTTMEVTLRLKAARYSGVMNTKMFSQIYPWFLFVQSVLDFENLDL